MQMDREGVLLSDISLSPKDKTCLYFRKFQPSQIDRNRNQNGGGQGPGWGEMEGEFQ